jgi:hypothetical protein
LGADMGIGCGMGVCGVVIKDDIFGEHFGGGYIGWFLLCWFFGDPRPLCIGAVMYMEFIPGHGYMVRVQINTEDRFISFYSKKHV